MDRDFCAVFFILIACQSFGDFAKGEVHDAVYSYECHQSLCTKVEITEANIDKAISLPVCRMLCGDTKLGTIWPMPTGKVSYVENLVSIDIRRISWKFPDQLSKQQSLWFASKQRFLEQLKNDNDELNTVKDGAAKLTVVMDINGTENKLPRLTLDTDESYKLSICYTEKNGAIAKIAAKTYFGARHGLETLSQLIVFDDIRKEYLMLGKVEIEDAPIYKWRGILLDTSRHYFSVKAIKRTIDALAMVKLNTFHWHITDSHSFPLVIKSHPDFHKLGAYSPSKIYTHEQILEIVQYGLIRGVRVMPEYDAPAHVSEGWQHTGMVACSNYQPWKSYCGEAPCGQLDPTVDGLYPILEDIYRELFELFNPDIFHMGGDEVLSKCWNASEGIRDWMLAQGWKLEEPDFHRLWGDFQRKALERVDKVTNNSKLPIILWTSTLTQEPYIDQYIDKSRYIIQVWTKGTSPEIQAIVDRGFRVIISNYDALYFDCGGPSFSSIGNNWCSPFIGWQIVYQNNLDTIAGTNKSLVLGAEAAVWSEQIDEFTLDYRLWPRSSALAERLWANPNQGYRAAEARMLYHRERLVANGIGAEALQPEWCLQNEKGCPKPGT